MKALMEAIVETLQDSIGSINFWNEVDKVCQTTVRRKSGCGNTVPVWLCRGDRRKHSRVTFHGRLSRDGDLAGATQSQFASS
jgi:hypothetical protein